jgi:hypothetical protein
LKYHYLHILFIQGKLEKKNGRGTNLEIPLKNY